MKHTFTFRILEFCFDHKLFGVQKKCWARLVTNYLHKPFFDHYIDVTDCNKCGYCGRYEVVGNE